MNNSTIILKNGWKLSHRMSGYFDTPTILAILRAGSTEVQA